MRVMSLTKKLLKTLIYVVMALALLAIGTMAWLRYEFSRVAQTSLEETTWNQTPVTALEDLPAPEPCSTQYPTHHAWFGGLHVHTTASFDSTAFGNMTDVNQAYAFARGTPVSLRLRDDPEDFTPPELTISTPLDFMAVTDHAESLGETLLCYDEQSTAYGALSCRIYRGDLRLPVEERLQGLVRLVSFAIFGQDRSARVCGEDGQTCRTEAVKAWKANQRSTEAWQDRSADCSFTTFHAYEYSLAEQASNLHRNVIFRNSTVPQEALSAKDAQTPEILWQWLDEHCIQGNPECDVLAIPHNSNWSSGRMWHPYSQQKMSPTRRHQLATLRAKLEPLVEIMQVKGDSECRNGLPSVMGEPDELCDFEKLRPAHEPVEDCGDAIGAGGMQLRGCVSRNNFVRYALTAGLAEEEKLGVNPFKLGIIAASDTHIGAPAVGRERGHQGSHGNDRSIKDQLLGNIDVPGGIATGSPVRYNPGGIAGIYAPNNSRDALFEAMQRRETFGTSGPRIRPRFFAGWTLDDNVCQSDTMLENAYANGVPMGGELTSTHDSATSGPVFLASATRDPRPGSNLLQRLQVVKGWIDDEGRTHQAVFDIAGNNSGEASVDKASCEVSGPGFNQLCTTWRDPQFDASRRAVYYLRVVENPSCRWSRHQCLTLPESDRPPTCSDPTLPWQIQERAWTSPIWYQPAG